MRLTTHGNDDEDYATDSEEDAPLHSDQWSTPVQSVSLLRARSEESDLGCSAEVNKVVCDRGAHDSNVVQRTHQETSLRAVLDQRVLLVKHLLVPGLYTIGNFFGVFGLLRVFRAIKGVLHLLPELMIPKNFQTILRL